MARIESYDLDEVLQNDELEERENIANENKRKKKIRRKRKRRFFLFLLLLLLFAYFISSFSNVNVVEMQGNQYYSKQQIMEIAKVSYGSKSVLAPSFLIERRLENDPLIKNATIHKTWNGVITIKIEEEKLIGYYQQNNTYYLLAEKGDDIKIKDSHTLANVPYLNGLNKEQRDLYKKSIVKAKRDSILLISEVLHYETSYNKNMLKLIMQDGHVVNTSFAGLKLLDSYTEMLKGLNTNLKCIVFAEETNTMYTEKCE